MKMTIADWLMIGAVLIGPIIAVRLTRYLDNKYPTKIILTKVT
jgi:hypothetical protein